MLKKIGFCVVVLCCCMPYNGSRGLERLFKTDWGSKERTEVWFYQKNKTWSMRNDNWTVVNLLLHLWRNMILALNQINWKEQHNISCTLDQRRLSETLISAAWNSNTRIQQHWMWSRLCSLLNPFMEMAHNFCWFKLWSPSPTSKVKVKCILIKEILCQQQLRDTKQGFKEHCNLGWKQSCRLHLQKTNQQN